MILEKGNKNFFFPLGLTNLELKESRLKKGVKIRIGTRIINPHFKHYHRNKIKFHGGSSQT